MSLAEAELIPSYTAYTRIAAISQSAIGLLGGYKAHNLDVLREVQDKPVIFAPNHRANIDSFVLGLTLHRLPELTAAWPEPLESRPVHFMAKENLWRYPVVRQAVQACGAFPVKRNAGIGLRQEQVDHIAKLVDNHAALVVFPEGTRRPKDRDHVYRQKLKTTIGFLALKHGLPIVPVGLAGPKNFSKLPMHAVFEPVILVSKRDDVGSEAFNVQKYEVMDALHEAMDRGYQTAKSYL
jgi:1-acyl-sn-glycerol-3-phosphate acyltransferase